MWVDMFIPGVDKVGGFSIVSTPAELPQVRLAVKAAQWPPAMWVHESARVGDTVDVRAGGR